MPFFIQNSFSVDVIPFGVTELRSRVSFEWHTAHRSRHFAISASSSGCVARSVACELQSLAIDFVFVAASMCANAKTWHDFSVTTSWQSSHLPISILRASTNAIFWSKYIRVYFAIFWFLVSTGMSSSVAYFLLYLLFDPCIWWQFRHRGTHFSASLRIASTPPFHTHQQ